MIYVATPYSDPDTIVVEARVEIARLACAALLNQHSKLPYSPIVHWHDIANEYDMPTDAKAWERLNFDMLRRAEALYVVCYHGWKESVGVQSEIAMAERLHMPIHYIDEFGMEVLA